MTKEEKMTKETCTMKIARIYFTKEENLSPLLSPKVEEIIGYRIEVKFTEHHIVFRYFVEKDFRKVKEVVGYLAKNIDEFTIEDYEDYEKV